VLGRTLGPLVPINKHGALVTNRVWRRKSCIT
jgi:hypothetical protein